MIQISRPNRHHIHGSARRHLRSIAFCCVGLSASVSIAQGTHQVRVKPVRLPFVSGATPGNSNGNTTPTTTYLRTSTSAATIATARRLIDEATRDYNAKAWLSAETTAWDAIKQAAVSVDLRAIERYGRDARANDSCESMLERARVAITEARDFAGVYGPTDDEAIRRIARGHQTGAIAWDQPEKLGPNEASDRYLDYARTQLGVVAADSVEAAQAMDLLAAIHLGRGDAKLLPGPTALCLRRAALQGQPANASLASRLGMHLADVGLVDEARWAMEHSLSIEFDPVTANRLVAMLEQSGDRRAANQWIAATRSQSGESIAAKMAPTIVELSPSEFASVSKSVLPPGTTTPVQSVATAPVPSIPQASPAIPASSTTSSPSLLTKLVGARLPAKDETNQSLILPPETIAPIPSESEKTPGAIGRFFNAFRRP